MIQQTTQSAQISYDEYTKSRYKIIKPIRLIELFGGIGSQAQALKNIRANFEHHRLVEIDRFAVQSYNAIHGTDFKPSDITKITAADLSITGADKYEYIITYSFPCQDLSKAGKGAGMSRAGGTRSGLLWEVERLLDELSTLNALPQILLMENVTDVHGKKNKADFTKWILKLEKLGYTNYLADLNAKDFSIPQSRDRTFVISLLGNWYYEFPKPEPLYLRLKDILEPQVDERYYLSETAIKGFTQSTFIQRKALLQKSDICNTLMSRDYKDPKRIIEAGTLESGVYAKMHEQSRRVYDTGGIAPTIHANGGGNLEPKIIAMRGREPGKQYENGTLTEQRKNIQQLEPRSDGITNTLTTVQKDNLLVEYNNFIKEPVALDEQNQTIRYDGTVGTLTTDGSTPKHNNRIIETSCRIRKLTPRECMRLMGWHDEQINKQLAIVSNTQAYKQAGNGIVVTVLERIFQMLL